MKIKLIGFISATALAWAVAAVPAFAGQLNWDFNTLLQPTYTPNTSLGTSNVSFTQGSQSIGAQSMSDSTGAWTTSSLDLWYKDGTTASEQGLGLAGDTSTGGGGEIYNPYGIQLDLTGPNALFGNVTIGSVQTGETYEVWGYNGSSWVSLTSGSGGDVVNVNVLGFGDYTKLIISDPYAPTQTQTSNDIVLMSVSTVPEPGTLALLAFGLAAVGFAAIRRRKARTDA